MGSAVFLSTKLLTRFSVPQVHNRCPTSPTRFYPVSFPSHSLRAVPMLVHPRLTCVSNSAESFCASSVGGIGAKGVADAIVLSVGGMTSSECESRVKKILENHAQVYIASAHIATETSIVWPTPEAKAEPNWDKKLGHELVNLLTTCGFKSNLRELDTFDGCLKNTPYSEWPGHSFVSLAPHDSEVESHAKEVDSLKVQVKNLLLDSTRELRDSIRCINSLCRLGVSYHFEEEIEEQLNLLFNMLPKFLEDNDYDLSTIANYFRVLRQYGYNVPSDVFKKFKNGDGEFKKDIASDVKGILCLYEACFLAIRGEDIFDEALAFTRKHLEVVAESSSPILQKYIRHALMFPCHRTIERLDALHYISYYEQDELANETLLKFAKLDFNGLQLRYKKELSVLSKWWIDTDVMKKFPYTRDRLVESYLWAVGNVFEPPYSSSRMMNAKYTVMFTWVDDTFDTYGTFEHNQLLTDTFLRIKDASDELPQYMKHIWQIYLDDLENYKGMKGCSIEESHSDETKDCLYRTSYLEEMIKEIVRCNFVETEWKKEGKAPFFDEYIKNGRVTSGYELFTSGFILGVEDMGMKEMLWVRSNPEMVIAAQFLGRLLNDLSGLTDEKPRQDFPKAVDCYMQQYGVPKDEAIESIRKIVENKWKVLNEEMMKPSDMPRILRKYTLNYCRSTILVNGVTDLYTYPADLKEYIISLLFKPFPV